MISTFLDFLDILRSCVNFRVSTEISRFKVNQLQNPSDYCVLVYSELGSRLDEFAYSGREATPIEMVRYAIVYRPGD